MGDLSIGGSVGGDVAGGSMSKTTTGGGDPEPPVVKILLAVLALATALVGGGYFVTCGNQPAELHEEEVTGEPTDGLAETVTDD